MQIREIALKRQTGFTSQSLSMNDIQKNHINNILNVLYTACKSEGGDGNAFWYVRAYKLNNIFEIVKEYNQTLRWPFATVELKDDGIHWGENQEWILITDKEDVYLNHRYTDWAELVLVT